MSTDLWQIDSSHSGIHFSVRHLVIAKVRGQFARWSGSVQVPDGDFTKASAVITIDAASIDTGVTDRDNHLRSADFFDVAKYPVITFKTTRVEPKGAERVAVSGSLTIKSVTKDVTFESEVLGQVKDPWGNERAAFSAKTAIDRRDFGLTWNQALETGGVVVGERIDIEIELEAVKQVQKVAAVA